MYRKLAVVEFGEMPFPYHVATGINLADALAEYSPFGFTAGDTAGDAICGVDIEWRECQINCVTVVQSAGIVMLPGIQCSVTFKP